MNQAIISRKKSEIKGKMATINIFSVYGQRFSDSFNRSNYLMNFGKLGKGENYEISTQSLSGVYQLDSVLKKVISEEDGENRYLVMSNRKEMIWDGGVVRAVVEAIETFARAGRDWTVLSCDGGVQGEGFNYSVFMPDDPSLAIDRQIKQVDCITGSFVVVSVDAVQKYAKLQPEGEVLNLRGGYQRLASGMAAYYVPSLFPCFGSGLISHFREMTALHDAGKYHGMSAAVSSPQLTVEEANTASVSIVIRTLFKRSHLLNRCLISIDYLARSGKFDCEIILATDRPVDIWEPELLRLRKEFPSLTFSVAVAEGRPGASRVRNLIAGIKATTGARVAIIDDDDFFSTDALAAFIEASDSLFSGTVFFDSQILYERWNLSEEGNWERHASHYGVRFQSSNWPLAISRSNPLPLCSVIHQGTFLRSAIDDYNFEFDLSEDFILYALLFSDVRMPPIVCKDLVGAYQSHRTDSNTDNVSTTQDRTEWDADTAAGVRDLIFKQKIDFTRYRQFADSPVSGKAFPAHLGQASSVEAAEASAIAEDLLRLLATASNRKKADIAAKRSHLGFLLKHQARRLRLKMKKVKTR